MALPTTTNPQYKFAMGSQTGMSPEKKRKFIGNFKESLEIKILILIVASLRLLKGFTPRGVDGGGGGPSEVR